MQVSSSKSIPTGPPTTTIVAKRPNRSIKAEPEEVYMISSEQDSSKVFSNFNLVIIGMDTENIILQQQLRAKGDDTGRTSRNLRLRVKRDSKLIATPATPPGAMHPPVLTSAPVPTSMPSTPPSRAAPIQTTTPTTPSLKIRLPRFGALNFQSQSAPVQPPTRSSSPSSGQTSTDSRLRRSSRQRLSTSASTSSKSSSSSSLGGLLASKSNGTGIPTTPPPPSG